MEFELKANSWHFWIVNFGGKRVSVYGSDICSYIQAFMKGLFWLTLSVFFGSIFVYGTGVTLYDGYFFFMEGTKVSLLSECIIMLWSVILGLVTILLFTFTMVEHVVPAVHRACLSVSTPENPSFIRLAYRKFKDKTCFRIKFK